MKPHAFHAEAAEGASTVAADRLAFPCRTTLLDVARNKSLATCRAICRERSRAASFSGKALASADPLKNCARDFSGRASGRPVSFPWRNVRIAMGCDPRGYESALGRGLFLQPAPIGFSGGDFNLYRCCANNPGRFVDPMGLLINMLTGTPDFWCAWTRNFNNRWRDPAFRDWWNRAAACRDPYTIGPEGSGGSPTLPRTMPTADDNSSAVESAQALEAQGGFNITRYGYPGDPHSDTGTRLGLGNANNILNPDSVALSPDVARSMGVGFGDAVNVNGHFIGHYHDSTDPGLTNRIDVYDPNGP